MLFMKKNEEEPCTTIECVARLLICPKFNFFRGESNNFLNPGNISLAESVCVCVCVYLDRVLKHCNRKYFGRHGAQKQTEVLVD